MCVKNCGVINNILLTKTFLPQKVRCMELWFILGRVRWQEIRAPVCADSERLVVDGLTAESHAIRHLLRFLI